MKCTMFVGAIGERGGKSETGEKVSGLPRLQPPQPVAVCELKGELWMKSSRGVRSGKLRDGARLLPYFTSILGGVNDTHMERAAEAITSATRKD